MRFEQENNQMRGYRQRHGHPARSAGFGGDDFGGGFGGGRGGRRGGGHQGGHRGGPGGGGRRGKRFAGDELRVMVLALLEAEPRHGYQLIRVFAERSADAYVPSPGVLYPLLTLLQDMELIAEAASEGRTRSFALTDAGRAELDQGRERADAAFARLEAMAAEAQRGDAAPVRRAMANLRTAAIDRLGRSADDAELGFAIAALLDETAQKIERL